LAVYGAPIKNRDHPEAAVRATLKMLRALDKINQWSRQRDLPKVSIRCGIHTGTVLCGNMGFHSRMKYGIMGEDANIPARLEELNKSYGTDNLISEATYDRLQIEKFVIRPIDYVYVRHADDAPELVFQVLATVHSTSRAHKLENPALLFSTALENYKRREFEKAEEQFTRTNQLMKDILHMGEDPPSILFIKRCQKYQKDPPKEDWNGVWDRPNDS